jgi:hypothetical protein
MKRMIGMLTLAAALGAGFAGTASAQIDNYVEMLRADVKTQRQAIADAALDLADDKATVFWPVYRKYLLELDAWGDKRYALIKDYAASYETMTDEKAKSLADQALGNQESRVKLLKKYFKEFSKIIGAADAARLVQVESALNSLIDLQIASELPLIKKGSYTAPATTSK